MGTQNAVKERSDNKIKEPKQYNVIMFNDELIEYAGEYIDKTDSGTPGMSEGVNILMNSSFMLSGI